MARILTTEQEHEIIALYKEYVDIKAIGEIISPHAPLADSTIRSIVKRHGVPPRPRQRHEGMRDETAQLADRVAYLYVDMKLSSVEIAPLVGRAPSTVLRCLRMRGLIRSTSEYTKLAYERGRRTPMSSEDGRKYWARSRAA